MTAPGLEPSLAQGALSVRWTGPAGEPVVTVTLDRPEVRNAQTPAMWEALAAVADALPPTTRVVVVRGSGPTFSSGIDLRMFAEGLPGQGSLAGLGSMPPDEADRTIARFQGAFAWLSDAGVVSVAAVQGAAVGAGFQLALACDLVLCAADARFAMKEPTLGLVPDLTGTHPLVRAVGYQRALELCLTGRWVAADEAVALGLALRQVPTDGLDAATDELVASLLAAPVDAARATKRLLRGAQDRTASDQRDAERREQAALLRALAGATRA